MNKKVLTKMKGKGGITLIALIITITVLLILAGVSIAMLTGENGILTQAQEAKKQNEIAKTKEQAKLDILAWKADKIAKSQDATLNDAIVKDIIDEKDYVETAGETSFTTKSGYEISYAELYTSIPSTGGEDTGNTIDWNAIVASLPTKYDEYLAQAQEKGQNLNFKGTAAEANVGIGTDGEVVNLSLWNYFKTDDGEGITLGKGEGSVEENGYNQANLTAEGKVQGKMPQYIYIKGEDKVYPVISLNGTFAKFSSLTEIPAIPTTVKTLTADLFYQCTELTSVEMPESITRIEDDVFFGCTGLTSIKILNSVTSIGFQAFYGCTGMTSIEIPSSVTSIGNGAFKRCEKLTTVNYTGTQEEWNALVANIGDYNDALTNANIVYNYGK